MKVGRYFGIDVHIHWTFWLLILVYMVMVARSGEVVRGLMAIAFILSAFLCVLLHEYGHALAARRFGIRTIDITLMPIGGLARLERLPEKPIQEFFVAIAGPLVNIAIAAVLFVVNSLELIVTPAAPMMQVGETFLGQLIVANLLLALFNMLPAFPMDGGRVLRSLLAMKVGHLRATSIAARLGRWMALAFAIWGIFVDWNPMLVLLAGFIVVTGTMELLHVRMRNFEQTSQASFQSFQWETDPGFSGSTSTSNNPHIIDAVDYRKIQ